jgi:hypothetical protein
VIRARQSYTETLRKRGSRKPNTESACRYSMEKSMRNKSGGGITLIPPLISLNFGLDTSVSNDIECAS